MTRKPAHWPVGRNGMTLVEIMVAMTIFAIVLTGILPLSIYVITYNRENTRLMQARNLMSNLAEQLKNMPQSNAWRTNDGDNTDLNDNTTGDLSVTNGIYRIRWNIAQPDANTQNIRIFVNWQSGPNWKSITSSLTLITGS
jgi:prepilin-type N-terminal cleavage/methylation domain-containing protein